MTSASAALALLLALDPAPAQAWRLWGEPSDKRIRPVQALADSHQPAAVLAALTPEFVQELRGTDLRQAHVLMGDSLEQLQRPDEALSAYQLGVKLFPRNVDLLTRQAGILHRMGLDEQARPLFHQALKGEPRHFGAHLGLAEIDRRLGFLARAASHYEVALETLERNASIWRDYADVLLAQRDWKTAQLALDRAAALEPENPEGRVLAGFARRAQGDLDGALSALDTALARGAGVGARRAKTLWLIEAGRFAQAQAAAEELLRESPGDAAALWARTRAELALGRPGRALEGLSSLAAPERQDFAARAARALRRALNGDGFPSREHGTKAALR